MILPNLTHLYLKMFINKLNENVKVLSLETSYEDISYLHANRWEQFIINKLPQMDSNVFRRTRSI